MRAYYPEDHLQLDESAARSAVEQLVGDEKLGRIWLIRYDGRTVGYVVLAFGFSLEFHGRDAFVDELYVEPAYRGRGLGKAALRFVEAVAPALGITALHLEVERANTRAQTLYRRTGYEDHDRYLMTKWIRRNE
ncbi:MAG: GNAT family N-acetyltransferase [Chloroflexi bacterium]|nr:GNAT family N-acetyltransferase [Chloroflexota bacterium]